MDFKIDPIFSVQCLHQARVQESFFFSFPSQGERETQRDMFSVEYRGKKDLELFFLKTPIILLSFWALISLTLTIADSRLWSSTSSTPSVFQNHDGNRLHILNEPGHFSLSYVSTYQKAIDFKTPSDRSVELVWLGHKSDKTEMQSWQGFLVLGRCPCFLSFLLENFSYCTHLFSQTATLPPCSLNLLVYFNFFHVIQEVLHVSKNT